MSGFTIEAVQTRFIKLGLKYLGSETERKVGTFLFDENVEWASSKDLHGMAALTFNDQECTRVMALIGEAMEPADYTWKTLWKAVRLLQHFVVFGAERCVDHAWGMQRQAEELVRYNSAQHSKTGQIMGAGVDYGEPVRRAATSLVALLKDVERIRDERQNARDPSALLPEGRSDDYVAPDPNAGKVIISRSQDFGVVQTSALGAKYTLEQTPGMYAGRPERYFDSSSDPRRRTSVDDAQWTRQALAPNLLELDLPPAAPTAASVETQDLVALQRQRQLEAQLRQQQQQLEQLKAMIAGGGNINNNAAGASPSHANILAAFNQPNCSGPTNTMLGTSTNNAGIMGNMAWGASNTNAGAASVPTNTMMNSGANLHAGGRSSSAGSADLLGLGGNNNVSGGGGGVNGFGSMPSMSANAGRGMGSGGMNLNVANGNLGVNTVMTQGNNVSTGFGGLAPSMSGGGGSSFSNGVQPLGGNAQQQLLLQQQQQQLLQLQQQMLQQQMMQQQQQQMAGYNGGSSMGGAMQRQPSYGDRQNMGMQAGAQQPQAGGHMW